MSRVYLFTLKGLSEALKRIFRRYKLTETENNGAIFSPISLATTPTYRIFSLKLIVELNIDYILKSDLFYKTSYRKQLIYMQHHKIHF